MSENYSILIVDDEKSITELLKEILVSTGYKVDTTNDSLEALELINKNAYDVLLTDLKMPKMSGIELIENALNYHPDIVPIIMTGYGTIESAVEAMKKGAAGYVPKPFRAKNIISLIQKELEAKNLRKENAYLKKIIAINDLFDSLSCEGIEKAFNGILDTFKLILPLKKLVFFMKTSPDENKVTLVESFGFAEKDADELEKTAVEAISRDEAYFEKITDRGKLLVLALKSKFIVNGVIIAFLPKDMVILAEDLRILRLMANRVSVSIENTWLIKGIALSLKGDMKERLAPTEYTRSSLVAEIASIISHEISNPLSAMQIATDYMDNVDTVSQKDKLESALSCIKEGIEKISDIISNLRSLSSTNNAQYCLVDVNALILEAIAMIDKSACKKRIRFETHFEEENPNVSADRDQLRQAFLNIIVNSVEAVGDEGGVIKIISKSDEDEKCVYIFFEDNGRGIAHDNLERIFDPFYSFKDTNEKRAGLGLTLAKKIVGRHQGSIKAESELGKGTTVTVKIYKDI
ncbi:response regulator [candidate division WOR-3 bacterium]|nr:response regulator [candidate division WOR-3 bacterium]